METEMVYLILTGFGLSILFTKITIWRQVFLGLVAVDLHKKDKPKVPKIGGVGIALAFSGAMVAAYLVKGSLVYPVILTAFLISCIFGLLDDYISFEPWRKIILASFGAIPLLVLIAWNPLTIIFLFGLIAVFSNWTNMLAGFNGLEIGLGAIALFFLALNTGAEHSALILLIYSGVLIGFLLFNKYPAKIFPGDSGTMPIGAVLAACTLLGAPLLDLFILFIPHIIDSALKFSSAGVMNSQNYKPSTVKKGYLVPGKSYLSLSKLLMRLKPMREWQLVAVFWIIEIGLGLVTLMV